MQKRIIVINVALFIKGRTIRENLEVFIAMKRYAAFLRGINISGKNKVPMAELKKRFEKLHLKRLKPI